MSEIDPDVDARPATDGATTDHDAATGAGRRGAAIGGWAAFVGGCLLLDAWVGGAVAVVVAVVVLAGLPTRILGALGAAAMGAAVVAVLVDGAPSEADVSPAFVSRSLVPHHLAFAAFALVGAWVVLGLVAHLRAAPLGDPVDEPSGSPARATAVAVVVLVAVAAVVASAAVLWG